MSAVDVLAVLRSLMTDAAITRMYDHDAEAKHAAAENALAAVAKLIDKARPVAQNGRTASAEQWMEFAAALARVGGAA